MHLPEDLKKKLVLASKSGKYLITISYADDNGIQHFYKTEKFLKKDIIPSMDHLKDELVLKEGLEVKWT